MITKNFSFKQYSFQYNFATDGGAIGSIEAPFTLPAGAIVTKFTLNIISAVVGSGVGADLSLGTGTGANFDVWVSTLPEAVLITGFVLPDVPGTPQVIAAGGEKPSITIGTDPLTAGLFTVTIEYIEV